MIKTLGDKFSKRGFDFVELGRSECGRVRTYSQYKEGIKVGYVVAEIVTSTPPELWESKFEKHEVFPSPEQFGKTAWQFTAADTMGPISKQLEIHTKILNRNRK